MMLEMGTDARDVTEIAGHNYSVVFVEISKYLWRRIHISSKLNHLIEFTPHGAGSMMDVVEWVSFRYLMNSRWSVFSIHGDLWQSAIRYRLKHILYSEYGVSTNNIAENTGLSELAKYCYVAFSRTSLWWKQVLYISFSDYSHLQHNVTKG